MKKVLQFICRLAAGDAWIIALPRILLMLLAGFLILFKPAAALKVCAWAFPFLGGAALLLAAEKAPCRCRPYCRLSALLPLLAFLFSPRYDPPGLWTVALTALLAAWKGLGGGGVFPRLITVSCALFAGAAMLYKSFTGDWFDYYPAAALIFFATAGWEAGNLKLFK